MKKAIMPLVYEKRKTVFRQRKRDGTGCTLPYGGELSRSESNNRNYTVRLQLNASKYFGEEQQHNISGSAGFEANASRVKSFTSVMRGYFKDRGMSFVKDVDLSVYPAYGNGCRKIRHVERYEGKHAFGISIRVI